MPWDGVQCVIVALPGHAHFSVTLISQYSKTCLEGHLKIDKTKILKTNGSLMTVQSIAWSILQYF